MSGRPHGYTKYKVERCRCDTCSASNLEYRRRRDRLIAYGRWQPYVDAEPVRAHVRALMAAGVDRPLIANLAGIHRTLIAHLLNGTAGRGPAQRVRPETAAKLLAVTADMAAGAEHGFVNGVGARRRLQALVAIGWPQRQLAQRLDMTPTNFGLTLRRQSPMLASTARAITKLYDELWDREPTTSRQAKARALNYARARGWAPPLAWDDDEIDNPNASPRMLRPPTTHVPRRKTAVDPTVVDALCEGRRPAQATAAERRAAVGRLRASNLHDGLIADRTGLRQETVQRIRKRLGLPPVPDAGRTTRKGAA